MLTLPLPCESRRSRAEALATAAARGQAAELVIAAWRGRRGREDVTMSMVRPSASRLQAARRSSSRTDDGIILFVDARSASCANHSRWRALRPSQLLLSQQVRSTARDVSPAGLFLEPVFYTGTPALDKHDTGASPGGIDEEGRLLKALVAKVRLQISSDRNRAAVHGSDDKEEATAERGPSSSEQKGEKKEMKKSNDRKQSRMHTEAGNASSPPTSPQKLPRPALGIPCKSTPLSVLEEKIFFLESVSVDTEKVLDLCPSIFTNSLEKLKSVIEYVESLGVRKSEVGRVLSMTPQILGLSVERDLRPAVTFLLQDVGLRKQDLKKVINRCPRLLAVGVDKQLRPTMQYLEGLGFTRMASVVSNNATLLTFNIETKLLPKLKFLEALGLSFEEAVTLVVRFPAIFNYGVEQNLQPKYDYLINAMGRGLEDLKTFPQYFGYSLEQRIRPRHEFLAQRNISISLPTFLKLSDDQFYHRFHKKPSSPVMGEKTQDGEFPNPQVVEQVEQVEEEEEGEQEEQEEPEARVKLVKGSKVVRQMTLPVSAYL